MGSAKKNNGKKRNRDSGREQHQNSSSSSSASATTAAISNDSSNSNSNALFLTSGNPGFEQHVTDHYQGFAHRSVDQLQPRDFHQQSRAALERLRDANYYQYDIVKAGGKHSSRTFVKRTLVGNPGITYKYLGLRLFAHSWSGPGVSPLLRSIGEMNQNMIAMTKRFPNHQNCEYNLTLINYMEPTIHTRVGFKDEANYGMGKVSVSWHADSSLENGSSIGVYHCLPTQKSSKWDWRIALRLSPESSSSSTNSAPKPIVVDTKDGDAYFLLGNFNETHQHCVLAGSQSNRISSTHRVAVTAEDTYDYILKRVKIARKRFRLLLEAIEESSSPQSKSKTNGVTDVAIDAKVVRYCQRVLTEVETEWIAQYWLQGAQHDTMHTWWQRPMKTLEAYWRALEVATARLVHHVCSSGSSADDTTINTGRRRIPPDVARVLIQEFKNRQSLREQWDERRAEKIYQRRIAEDYRPVERPRFDDETDGDDNDDPRLPKDLAPAIRDLRQVLAGGGKIKKAATGEIDPPSESTPAANDVAGSSSSTGTERNDRSAEGATANEANSTVDDPDLNPDHRGGEQDSNAKKKKRRKKNKKKKPGAAPLTPS